MKLELKHLAPYLPYRLKYIDKDTHELTTMRSISTEINMVDFGWGNAHELHEFIPILQPLSDLTKEIEHNGERFVPLRLLGNYKHHQDPLKWAIYRINREDIEFRQMQKLFEWHFDVFGLIDAKLAIDINEL